MGNWRDAFPSKWFSHKDLDAGPILVTIKRVTMEDIAGDGEKRPVVWFHEHDKGLGLNITNGNSIEAIAESSDPDVWEQQRPALVLFKTETDFQGKRVPCVRIRRPKPGAVVPEPVDEHTADDSIPF